MEINQKITLTVEDMAQILEIGKSKAYELVKTPGFPFLKIGRQIRIPTKAFYTWINEQCI
jgi:excisionase family DNA binding protein